MTWQKTYEIAVLWIDYCYKCSNQRPHKPCLANSTLHKKSAAFVLVKNLQHRPVVGWPVSPRTDRICLLSFWVTKATSSADGLWRSCAFCKHWRDKGMSFKSFYILHNCCMRPVIAAHKWGFFFLKTAADVNSPADADRSAILHSWSLAMTKRLRAEEQTSGKECVPQSFFSRICDIWNNKRVRTQKGRFVFCTQLVHVLVQHNAWSGLDCWNKNFLATAQRKNWCRSFLFFLCVSDFFGQVASHFLTSRSFEVRHGLLMVWAYFIEFFLRSKPIVSSCFQSTFFTSFFL